MSSVSFKVLYFIAILASIYVCNARLVIMISAHGGYRGATSASTTTWTYKSNVKFFVKKDAILWNADGLNYQKWFETPDIAELDKAVVREVTKDDSTKNQIEDYSFSFGPEFELMSGVYVIQFKDRDPTNSKQVTFWPIKRGQKISLSSVASAFDKLGNIDIYWNACTKYMGNHPTMQIGQLKGKLALTGNVAVYKWREAAIKKCDEDYKQATIEANTILESKIAELTHYIESFATKDMKSYTKIQHIEAATKKEAIKIRGSDTAFKPDFLHCHGCLMALKSKIEHLEWLFTEKWFEIESLVLNPQMIDASTISTALKQMENYYDYYDYYNYYNAITIKQPKENKHKRNRLMKVYRGNY